MPSIDLPAQCGDIHFNDVAEFFPVIVIKMLEKNSDRRRGRLPPLRRKDGPLFVAALYALPNTELKHLEGCDSYCRSKSKSAVPRGSPVEGYRFFNIACACGKQNRQVALSGIAGR